MFGEPILHHRQAVGTLRHEPEIALPSALTNELLQQRLGWLDFVVLNMAVVDQEVCQQALPLVAHAYEDLSGLRVIAKRGTVIAVKVKLMAFIYPLVRFEQACPLM